MRRYRILAVCLGNICRSPTAEAALRRAFDDAGLSEHVEVDSAGTTAFHVGDGPDPRMVEAGAERGLRLDGTVRRVAAGDFERFDLLLAMDRANAAALRDAAPDDGAAQRVRMLREFSRDFEAGSLDVPDPYYGGPDGFRHVVDLVVDAAQGVVEHVRDRLDAD